MEEIRTAVRIVSGGVYATALLLRIAAIDGGGWIGLLGSRLTTISAIFDCASWDA